MAEARLFQALSDPTRLRIVGILAGGPSNVTGIVNLVGAAQPAVSRHLRILREVGLIHDRRLGKEVEYSLDARRVEEVSGWLVELVDEGGGINEVGEVRGSAEKGRAAPKAKGGHSRRKRGKGPNRTKPESGARKAQDWEADSGPAYLIEREEEPMDDFLL